MFFQSIEFMKGDKKTEIINYTIHIAHNKRNINFTLHITKKYFNSKLHKSNTNMAFQYVIGKLYAKLHIFSHFKFM